MAQYDYIIVGAGSAGCVLANRLTASRGNRVLLLEAGGPDNNPFIHLPAGFARTLKDPAVNWLYRTAPDPGTNNRTHVWPRGKVLGGSSAINGMLYVRGQAQDYDLWRQLGNAGWSWEDVLPYFKKSEDYESSASQFYGQGGPLHVSEFRDRNPVSNAVIEAGLEAGLEENPDPNSGVQGGIGYTRLTIRKGFRVSAATAYLKPAAKRPNLRIETHALARRILFRDKRATGIEYEQNGQILQAVAGREIILSGGAINSPQLLQLSGIGPVNLLKEKGIDVVHNLPGVGENLQDHFVVGINCRLENAVTANQLSRGLPFAGEVVKWLTRRRGLLSASPSQVDGYVRSRPELATPDIQFIIVPATLDGEKFANEGIFELERHPGLTVGTVNLRPESRGHVRIRAADPKEHPVIVPNYLEAPADQTVTVEGLKWGRRIISQPALARFNPAETDPGAQVQSDGEFLSYARDRGTTVYHPAGTCKMGADAMAVVDDTLSVHGIGHLRVVDASIMPRLVSGNTNAPTIMIAEKAADMILDRQAGH